MTGPDWTERFWAKVDKNGPVPVRRPELGPCWLWTASVTKRRGGYGQFLLNRRMRKSHQVSYELTTGPIPRGLELDHLCRTPRCVNPAHLEAVTRRVNFLRGDHPTAVTIRTGVCQKGLHAMTEENTIRHHGKRQCRACDNAAQRKNHARRKAVA